RCVFPALDSSVQSLEAEVHGVAEDVRDRLADPCTVGLSYASVSVQLMADLCDTLALKVPAEDQGDHARLFLFHLEDPVHVVVAVRARIRKERIRFLHRTIERVRALLPSRSADHLPLIKVPLDAQLAEGLLLRFRGVVLQELAGGSEPHVHLPKQEGVGGSSVRAVLAQRDFLLADRSIRARVRTDLKTHEALAG